ncbi:MAG: CPBP family intramembrane glutamic endopeptidase [bacterium]
MAERSRKPSKPASARTAPGGFLFGSALGGDYTGRSYSEASRRPLEILFFLLPFIAYYEYELVRALRSPDGLVTNGAHLAILRLFDAFGLDAVALSLPGFLLAAIFLVQHVLSRGPWIVDLSIVGRMFVESIMLSVPLLVFAALLERLTPLTGGVDQFSALPLGARIAVSIGAGLYEELVFRMVLIGAFTFILTELTSMRRASAVVTAVVLSSIAFALYHPLAGPDGSVPATRVVFFLGGGLYFGLLYVQRGFGITAATHAIFDIVTALMIPTNGTP